MYDPVLLARASAQLVERCAERRARTAVLREEIYVTVPDIADIDAEMRTGLLCAVRQAFAHPDGGDLALEECRERNLALRARRTEILVDNGYPSGALDDQPDCVLCGDQGYSEGKPCVCLRKLHSDMQREQLSECLDITSQSFEAFDLSLFSTVVDTSERDSPRENMAWFLKYCRKYARCFSRDSANLLLRGGPGLGKTFLCACIAGVVSKGPFWVVYETAASAIGLMEAVKFARDTQADVQNERLFACDLLLLDDLGSEFSTQFSQSALFSLVSARLAAHRPIIATTALGEEELRRRYPSQLVSRLESFELLPLFGTDLRRQI